MGWAEVKGGGCRGFVEVPGRAGVEGGGSRGMDMLLWAQVNCWPQVVQQIVSQQYEAGAGEQVNVRGRDCGGRRGQQACGHANMGSLGKEIGPQNAQNTSAT